MTAIAALFFLAPGIVGMFRVRLNIVERAILIIAACIMVIDPIDWRSVWGLIPLLIGAAVLVRNYLAGRPARPAGAAA